MSERLPLRIHPRVFAALGADLVTNDVVAVTELVKNAYDALASKAVVRFLAENGGMLEIEDDGCGMSRRDLEDGWCLVATPHKLLNPRVGSGSHRRRVVGSKGLGRLSAARLGSRLHLVTQAAGQPCWELTIDWESLAAAKDLDQCHAVLRPCGTASPFASSGTRIQIQGLRSAWDDRRLQDLDESLARLLCPFKSSGGFDIYLQRPGGSSSLAHIDAPDFLQSPTYSLNGSVLKNGSIQATYRHRRRARGKSSKREISLSWTQVRELSARTARGQALGPKLTCGPFTFDLRAWDSGPTNTKAIAGEFHVREQQIRKAIRAYKGISLYRDGVLVLPKSDGARDWLGLDVRRISRIGMRLSTTQLVGNVEITSDANPGITDTSDRERLVETPQSSEFETILRILVATLEAERTTDRPKAEKPTAALFEAISADQALEDLRALPPTASAKDAVPIVQGLKKELASTRTSLQERFVYYSQLATVGVVAHMIVHEIRNRTSAIDNCLSIVKARFGPFRDPILQDEHDAAVSAVHALERLADTFAPLASRSFRRGQRSSVLEDRLRGCLSLLPELKRLGIGVHVPTTSTAVGIDPGELDTILLNLLANAAFWLGQKPAGSRRIRVEIQRRTASDRVRFWIHDSGPGLREADLEKVFLPGVTRKPGGLGMGLTVASELVAAHSGQMVIRHPGRLGGASFGFDLPLATNRRER